MLHPAPYKFVYDWQGGEFHSKLGGDFCDGRDTLIDRIESGPGLISYGGPQCEEDPEGEEFEWWCNLVFEASGQIPARKVVAIDESQDLNSPHVIPPGLTRILTRGRRRRMDSILAASAANQIHNTGRNQVTEFYCFRCIDKNSLLYPASLGIDPDEVQKLEDGEFIFKDMRSNSDPRKLDLFEGSTKP